MPTALAYIRDIFNSVSSVVRTADISDLLDILVLSYLVYKGIKLIRETRAEQLLKGIGILVLAYVLVDWLSLTTMGFLFQNFFQVGIIAVIVMFQPELRRALEKVGRTKVSKLGVFSVMTDSYNTSVTLWQSCINSIVEATKLLSSTMTGALIVIERQTRLGEQIDTGTMINADTSAELLCNIFYPNTPLHDGAVVLRDGNILAAGCFLPKPQKEELVSKNLGSRHRAAIGMSEISDAIVVIVSEETGIISVAENGQLTRGFTQDGLRTMLEGKLIPERTTDEKEGPLSRLFGRGREKKND